MGIKQLVLGVCLGCVCVNVVNVMAETTLSDQNTGNAGKNRNGEKISQVEISLVGDIKKARNSLSQTQKKIAQERAGFASEISSIENDVRQLREQASLVRRKTDESALSLSTLEQRLSTWQQQQDYQQRIMYRFAKQQNIDLSNGNQSEPDFIFQIESIENYFSNVKSELFPAWQVRPVILPSGDVVSIPTLMSGPVNWFWDNELQKSGLLDTSSGVLKSAYQFNVSKHAELKKLVETGMGMVTFDPSLGRALASAQNEESTLEHVQKGGLWALPILLFALFAVSIALFKALQLWRLPAVKPYTEYQLRGMRADSESESNSLSSTTSNRSMQNTLIGLFIATEKGQLRDDQLFSQLIKDKHRLDSGIGAIAITASVAPLLGLLGTVSGMIETFKMMTLYGSGDPGIVSGGIAQALVTTELGLVVAIPALILNALLSRKAKHYYSQLESFSIQLSQLTDSQLQDNQSHDGQLTQYEAVA